MQGPTGKGYFIWQIKQLFEHYGGEGADMSRIVAAAVAAKLQHVIVKIATNSWRYNLRRSSPLLPALIDDYLPALTDDLHAKGIEVWGYAGVTGYSYERPELNAKFHVQRAKFFGMDGLVADAEGDAWLKTSDRWGRARRYASTAKTEAGPDYPVWLSTYRFPRTSHPEYPAKQFMEYLDGVLPQVYWVGQHNPVEQLTKSVAQWRTITDKPIVPTGSAYTESRPSYRMPDGTLWLPTEEDLIAFEAAAKQMGFTGADYWEWAEALEHGLHNSVSRLSAFSDGGTSPEPPIPPVEPPPVKNLDERVTVLEGEAIKHGWEI